MNAFLHSRPPQYRGSRESELSTNSCKLLRLCLNSSKNYVQSAMRTLRQVQEGSRIKGKQRFIKYKEIGHLSRASQKQKPQSWERAWYNRLESGAPSEEVRCGREMRLQCVCQPVSHRCGVSFCLNSSGGEHTDS